MKDSVIWNIEQGQKLTGPQIGRAEVKRTELYHRVREFMQTHEFLICPVNQVPPFDINQQWVQEINDVKMDTYIPVNVGANSGRQTYDPSSLNTFSLSRRLNRGLAIAGVVIRPSHPNTASTCLPGSSG